MRIKMLVEEDFTNYKKAAMFIGTISCGGKCCTEAGIPLSVCQNDGWRSCNAIHMENKDLIARYIDNDITHAIVFGGLEPFEQFHEVYDFIKELREYGCDDDVVIYTGYYKHEIARDVEKLSEFPNIVIKFGRFVPDSKSRYDEVLGITLVSENQYAERIS